MSNSTEEKQFGNDLQSFVSVLTSLEAVDHEVTRQIRHLSKDDATREEVQYCIQRITQQLLQTISDMPKVVLAPVLRSGLAMWNVANVKYSMAETIFPEGKKNRRTGEAKATLRKTLDLNDKNLIILDPIIATGDTLLAVLDLLKANGVPRSITVLTCYASPEGVTRIRQTSKQMHIVVGCLANGVDEHGYLLPATNGDLGDKLYGKPGPQ